MSIRFKLVIFAILCSILPLLVVFSLAFNVARSSINETVEKNLIAQATEELYIIQRRLVKTKKRIISMGELAVMQNVSHDDSYGNIQDELEQLLSLNPNFSELLVTNIEGIVVASTDPSLIGSNQHDTWQHRVARLGIPHDGPVVTVNGQSQKVAKQSVPIYTTFGRKKIIGVLMGSIDWDRIQTTLSSRKLFEGDQSQSRQIILQSRNNNTILYSSDGATPPEGLLQTKSDKPTFQQLLHGDAQYMTASIPSRAMDEFRDPDWQLHLALDSDIAYARVHELRNKFVITGAVVLVLVTFLAYLLARSIVSPVKSLVDSADRLASGNYDDSLNTSSSRDEIGQLAKSFEKMRTAIKDKEQKLIAETNVSKQAAKLKGEFLANMSHEVRTPINGVLGMTELMMNTDLDQTQSRYAATIFRSGQSLLGVINDILDFSKIEAGKLDLQNGAFNLRDMVEDCVELLAEGAHAKGVELALHMQPDCHVAYRGDANRLRQILLNLMGNAVKFTKEGEVKLRVTFNELDDSNTEIRFDVVDTGIGIEKDALGTIFESFVQADGTTTRRFGGTGLGLAISTKLVELMNGQIGVESELGCGSNFWFTAKVEKLSDSIQEAWRSTEELKDKRILIVDDNKTNCEILQSQILCWGAEPVVTTGGEEALTKLDTCAANGRSIDVVILDMHMPGMNGLELAMAIRERKATADTKLVLLSSVCDQLDTETCKSIGIDSMITKPVRQPVLYNCLTAAIADRTMMPSKMPVEKIQLSQLSGKVLLAEDNPVNQDMMLELLKLLGVETVLAEDGRQALDAIAKESFDVVLMDCQMPVLDGFEATREIRKQEQADNTERRIPIVALTANALQGDREICLASGMDEYLSKPVSSSQLRAMLSNWLVNSDKRQQEDTHRLEQRPGSNADIPTTQTLKENAEPVLDPIVFNEVLTMASQASDNFYERLIEKYTFGSDDDISRIGAAIDIQDLEAISASAHRLKSSSANLGAKRLATACQELEQAAKAGTFESASAYLTTIKAEREQALKALQAPRSKVA